MFIDVGLFINQKSHKKLLKEKKLFRSSRHDLDLQNIRDFYTISLANEVDNTYSNVIIAPKNKNIYDLWIHENKKWLTESIYTIANIENQYKPFLIFCSKGVDRT